MKDNELIFLNPIKEEDRPVKLVLKDEYKIKKQNDNSDDYNYTISRNKNFNDEIQFMKYILNLLKEGYDVEIVHKNDGLKVTIK